MGKRFIKDYQIIEDGQKTRLVYTGALWRPRLTPAALRCAQRKILGCACAAAALFIGMGVAGGQSTRAAYVGVPYALAVVPVVYVCVDAVKFFRHGAAMERVHYEGSFLHMLAWAAALQAAAVFLFIGSVVYLCRAAAPPASEYAFPPLAGLLFAAGFYLFGKLRGINREMDRQE